MVDGSLANYRDRHDQYNYQDYPHDYHPEHHDTSALRSAQRVLLCTTIRCAVGLYMIGRYLLNGTWYSTIHT